MGKRSKITLINMKPRKKRLRTTFFEYSSEEEIIANNSVVINDEILEGNSNKF